MKLNTNIGKKADYMRWNPERIGALTLGSEKFRYVSSNFMPSRIFTPVFLQNVNSQLHLDKPNKSHSHTTWAYGVVVSMFDFHRSDRGSNLGRGGIIL